MDTSEVTALTSDRSDNVVTAVSSSAEERRSSDVGCSSAEIKLPENGEIMPESISDNFSMDRNIDANFCIKTNMSGSSSSSAMFENSAFKSAEEKIMTDCRDVDKDDRHVDQVCGTNVTADGVDDDNDEDVDSRSQTPLQDELEPEADELSENQMPATSNTELSLSVLVNPSHDSTVKTSSAECTAVPVNTSAAVQNSREENGEVSDDDNGEDTVNADSVSQQVLDDVKEKPTKELESQKVFCVMYMLYCHTCVNDLKWY